MDGKADEGGVTAVNRSLMVLLSSKAKMQQARLLTSRCGECLQLLRIDAPSGFPFFAGRAECTGNNGLRLVLVELLASLTEYMHASQHPA
ncbi:hypothetical protein IG631_22414 [Alternaria alternata]|nr:hypothetical protein IG631_22414 [Alternaria alternata]